jgi:hypothetical protein
VVPGGEGGAVLVDGSMRRCSKRLDPTVGLGVDLRSREVGQEGVRLTGGEQLLRSGLTGGNGFGVKSGEHRDGGREHGSGVDPGTWAELLQRSQAAGLQWIGVPAAAGLGSKQRQGSGHNLRFWGGAVGMRWVQGVA